MRSSRERIGTFLSIIAAAIVGFSARPGVAQQGSVTLRHTVAVPPAEAASAILVVLPDGVRAAGAAQGGAFVAPAVVVAAPAGDGVVVLGRVTLPAAVQSLTSVAIVRSPQGGVTSQVRSGVLLDQDLLALLSSADVEARLQERRSALRSWESRVAAQSESLGRLSADAASLAKVGDLIGTEEQLLAVQRDTERLSAALASAKGRVELVKQHGVPPNYTRREAQLVEQVSELSTALKSKEASATQRVAAASAELQRKLNLIDETKDQQLAVLQGQLKRLRTERERLEREVAEQNGQ